MVLNADFVAFIASLNARDVRYLVVGGYAVAYHGHPRYTKDLAVWIERDADNADRLLQALRDFGFGSLDLDRSDFLNPDQVIQLGYPPNRIDLLSELEGVTFPNCHEERVSVTVDGERAWFIGLQHLKTTKRETARHQDWADLENLP